MPHVGIFAEQKGLVSQTERNALNMRERAYIIWVHRVKLVE